MFLSLGIVYRKFRYQIGFRLLELPLPATRNAPHGPREVPHEIDILVPVSALLGGLRAYQRPQQGFPKQVFPSPATGGPPETPNPEVGKFLELQPISEVVKALDISINLDFLQQAAQLRIAGVG